MVIHDFLSYLFIVAAMIYTYWGWTLFDRLDDTEAPRARYIWLFGMIGVIVILACVTIL